MVKRNKKTQRMSKSKRRHRGGSCPCSSGSGIFRGGNNDDSEKGGNCDGAVKISGGSQFSIPPFDLSNDPQHMTVEGRSYGGKKKSRRRKKRKIQTKKIRGGVINWSNIGEPSWNVFGHGLAPPI